MRQRLCAILAVVAVLAAVAAVGCARDHSEARSDPRCVRHDAGVELAARGDPEPAASPVEHDAAPIGGLCDGSSDPKVFVSLRSVAGSIFPSSAWKDYGFEFLVVDGRCRYWALSDSPEGLHEGVLSAEQLEDLTRDLALNELGTLPSSRDQCASHWEDALIASPDQSLRCACMECVTEAGTTAMERAFAWIDRLVAEGEPSMGKLRVVALEGEPVEQSPPFRTQSVLRWPLQEPVQYIRDLVYMKSADRGVVFEGEDAAAIRAIRRRTSRMELWPGYFPSSSYVSDCGKTYRLELRDLLPHTLAAKLEAFAQAGWKRPKLASCRSWSSSGPQTDCPPAD